METNQDKRFGACYFSRQLSKQDETWYWIILKK
jgi:hypothetical protein